MPQSRRKAAQQRQRACVQLATSCNPVSTSLLTCQKDVEQHGRVAGVAGDEDCQRRQEKGDHQQADVPSLKCHDDAPPVWWTAAAAGVAPLVWVAVCGGRRGKRQRQQAAAAVGVSDAEAGGAGGADTHCPRMMALGSSDNAPRCVGRRPHETRAFLQPSAPLRPPLLAPHLASSDELSMK